MQTFICDVRPHKEGSPATDRDAQSNVPEDSLPCHNFSGAEFGDCNPKEKSCSTGQLRSNVVLGDMTPRLEHEIGLLSMAMTHVAHDTHMGVLRMCTTNQNVHTALDSSSLSEKCR